MAKDVMLTTVDNPFDPFEQFDDWRRYDEEKGYYSCSRLARMLEKDNINVFGDLSQHEIDLATEHAIDELISCDFLDLYKKVTREVAIA